MTDNEKPKYGYFFIRPFAALGILGVGGAILAVLSFQFPPPFQWFLLGIGIPLAGIGLWLGLAYVRLSRSVFNVDNEGVMWSTVTKFDKTLRGDEKVLDVGCGTGRVAISIAKRLTTGQVIGIDLFEWVSWSSSEIPIENARIEGVGDRTEFKHGDATELPFEDASFDIVTMGSVLHEIEEEALKIKALNEVNRVLKPGGRFVIVELIRNRKMVAWLLFFAYVFKPLEYWNSLFGAFTDFHMGTPNIIKAPIDTVVYIMEKPGVLAEN
ncbi:MAG: class I SAM-dependent methyltransferase [Promethearchaeota archaeon]